MTLARTSLIALLVADHVRRRALRPFDEGTATRVIDLPGKTRVIKPVEFRYGNLPGGGKAQVELWAK